ncbi:uncharacterized protein CcaverHIS019_0407440 [Cutaneotrichosporon cavernicola]|uniref:Fork-head domain-containing protein n=1 Tax=Cutaneotrichosporon cavernicola TaxID=279322 RepID=A0AA48L4P8_9TREE|nr:uncharacterized protein CcaverHIS019_0407440 [Cutaneotrichosporon cavernicola]BEI91924.1 hypothetical protein CcaverHIS019_0407440 [Cutaneotrichosporon cavernicola]
MSRYNSHRPSHVMASDDEGDELSPWPFPISSPSPQAATTILSTRTLRSHRTRAQSKPQVPQVKAQVTQPQPAASARGPKRSRPTPRRANKHASETTNPAATTDTRSRRSKRPRTPTPLEENSEDDEGERERERDHEAEEPRPLSRHRSRSRSLSVIPTVDMPPLTHPAPDDSAVRALGLLQSSRPGAAALSLNRDHLIRMREGHFARARPTRKKDKNRDWKNLTMSEAAWTRLEEIGCVTKGRSWTAHEGYDDDGNPVKPDLPYVILTKLVIASSPRKMLTLNQNSIRHNLSMNPAFVNVERPLSEGGLGTGKGGYWKVSEDTTTSHRGRGKKPRLEAPADGRIAVDLRSPAGLPTGNGPLLETYPPRPLVHMQASFGPYPGSAHLSPVAYAPPTITDRSSVYSHGRQHYPEHGDSNAAFATINNDSRVFLSPLAEPGRNTTHDKP